LARKGNKNQAMQIQKLDFHLNQDKTASDRQVILFDLSIRGHHPNYIQHLIKYWLAQNLSGVLYIVVSPRFLHEHAEVVELAQSYSTNKIEFVAITIEEEAALRLRKSKLARNWRNFQEWELFFKYALKLRATQALIMYFDTYFLPLALGAKSPCPFSGIYFRPTFHYGEFPNYQFSWQEGWQHWREKLLISRILANPQLKTLFCLDPFAVKHLEKLPSQGRAVYLPDPVEIENTASSDLSSIREKLGIEANRQIFLLFGALNGRKGIYQLLEAIQLLPTSLCQKLCLLLVGESSITSQLKIQIDAVCQVRPVQIIGRYEFIPEQDVQVYFQLADVILAPYQRHVGMSGILLLAAAAQKPVLSSDYGLMGEMVRRYSLGLTVDSTNPSAIAKGLTQLLLEPPSSACDRDKMKSFAQQNSAERFARIIFEQLLSA
jgi:glycosyltransferase involved in cell wall biosynthesis